MCGKSKTLLVISGEVEEAVLEAAWQEILSEYSTLIRTEKSATVFDAYKRMIHAKSQMNFIELALTYMRAHYDCGLGHAADVAEKVLLQGFGLVEDNPDYDAYMAQIDAVEMEARSLVVFFNQYKAQYEALAPKGEETAEERDRMSYIKELALLSRFMGDRINPEQVTVLDYAGIVNFYLESNKKES